MPSLFVTEVKVHRIKPENQTPVSPLRAFARIVLNGELVVNGLRIVEGRNGLFVSFPSDHDKRTGERHGIVYPISKDLMEAISARVLQEFATT